MGENVRDDGDQSKAAPVADAGQSSGPDVYFEVYTLSGDRWKSFESVDALCREIIVDRAAIEQLPVAGELSGGHEEEGGVLVVKLARYQVERERHLTIDELKSALFHWSRATAPNTLRPPIEPNAIVHEVLLSLLRALERDDRSALNEIHKPAASYLLTNAIAPPQSDLIAALAREPTAYARSSPDPVLRQGSLDVATPRAFANWLVAEINRLIKRPDDEALVWDMPMGGSAMIPPWSVIGKDDPHFGQVAILGQLVMRGGRAFRELREIRESDAWEALEDEFKETDLDNTDTKEIARRTLCALGVPRRVAWSLFKAADAMRASRERKRKRKQPSNKSPR